MLNNDPRPKVAIFSSYPPDMVSFSGGVETATAGLLEGLRAYQAEFDFRVVSFSKVLSRDLVTERDGFRFHFLSLRYAWQRPRQPLVALRTLGVIRRIAPSLIHCQDNTAMALAAIWSGGLRLFTIHGVKRQEASKRIGWERWSATAEAWLEPYLQSRFENFICISNYSRRVLGGRKRVFDIPNAVRSAFFRVKRTASPDRPILLFVGVLSPLKGPMELIRAHRQLRKRFPKLQTVLCGEAEATKYMRALEAMQSDGISFPGRVDTAELENWLIRATALVLPSKQENLPIVIAEAMAAGLPVVATRVGGVPEMVGHDHTGLLFQAGDAQGLTSCLEHVLASPHSASEMGQRGKEKAALSYHPDQIACRTVEVYRSLLKQADA